MKKLIFFFVAFQIVTLSAFSQTCNLALKDGSKININILSWTNPLLADMKFQKAKEEKKDEQIAQYNAGILSGQTKPTSTYPMTYKVKKAAVKDGDEYTLTTNINGTDYSSYFVCSNDTLYISRNRGPIEVPDGKGGIYGYALQGTQKLPMTLKVGDVLPTFEDVSIVFPTTTDMTVKKQVFSHNSTSTTKEFGFATDSYTGESGFGEYYKTTTKAVYNTIDVNVRRTLSSSAHFIHYMNAAEIMI